ncbi:hypothetical protein D3C76_429730 [compost metagenome]
MIRGMRAGYILPTMIPTESYHTRNHGVSVYKGLNLDKTKLIFVDKNKLIRLIDNTFEGLVQFLAVNRVTQLGIDTTNQENGIGL